MVVLIFWPTNNETDAKTSFFLSDLDVKDETLRFQTTLVNTSKFNLPLSVVYIHNGLRRYRLLGPFRVVCFKHSVNI